MPNNTNLVSMFETRKMIQMLDQTLPTRTFLKNTFFANVVTSEQENVDIDIRKGKRRIAPFVSRLIGSKTVDRLGYINKSYKPPVVGVDMITTAEDLIHRSPNESIYGAKSPMARMGEIMANDIRDMDEQITRREEWMCAQILTTGKIPMVGEGVNEVLDLSDDWHFDKLSGMDSWDDLDNADIHAQFRKWQRQISQQSGLTADIAILGQNAVDKLYANKKWREEQKFIQMSFGNYNPKYQGDGVTFIGIMPSVGIELYSYNEWYLADDGKEYPMVDPDVVIIGSTKAYTSMMYGVIVDPTNGAFALPRVPKSWIEPKPGQRFVQLSSRPIAVPHQIDGFITATVCSGPLSTEQKPRVNSNKNKSEESKE